MLQVSRSGFYAWLKAQGSPRRRAQAQLTAQVIDVYHASHGIYGVRRVYHELRARGVQVGRDRVWRVMQRAGLRNVRRRRYKATTDSNHTRPTAPNRLRQQFSAPAPNRIWTGDLTYIRTGEGWLYLAVVLDVFSRRIVGWSMQATMDESLVTTAFLKAVQQRAPQAGLFFHSDRGAQYCSRRFQRVLRGVGAQASMSGSGNCYDNAVTESFFSSLKRELVHVTHFPTRESARRAIFRYIEEFYNLRRRHSTLAYLSPTDDERRAQRLAV